MKALTDRLVSSPRDLRCRRSAHRSTVLAAATDRPEGQPVAPPGRLVAGRYRLRSLLGTGGMGVVWNAEDELLRRPVALKQVTLNDPASEESRKAALVRALGEARAAARVHHDGVVAVHDIVKDDERRPWIVMELLSGPTLAELLEAEGPLSIEEVTRVGVCLLDALEATHRAGVVHGDVKPGNVHLCENGRVVLTDFGIACAADHGSSSPTPMSAGSPAYVSPEPLGATLFTAVEGRPPFDKGDLFATLTAVACDEPVLIRAGPLRPVIEGLLAKEPDRRLNTVQAQAALRAMHSERPTPNTNPEFR